MKLVYEKQMFKKLVGSVKKFFGILGPGLITGASDDDPSGIATYSQAGAQFGFSTLWSAWVTFPLMAAIQEMCARIGMVSGHGLSGILKRHYSKGILYIMLLFSFPAIVINIGANIEAMGAVANMIFPSVAGWIFSIVFTGLLMICIIYFPYRKISRTLKYLAMILLVYFLVPFVVDVDWGEVARATFIPHFTTDKKFISIVVAILGTTISPYLFFWQASMEVEELKEKKLKNMIKPHIVVDKQMLVEMKEDVNLGMLFANIVMFFIVLTTGAVLFKNGVTHIETVEDAAKALQPIAGDMAYYLFAVGIIGTGFLSIPVLSGSLSYMFSETFGWKMGLNKKFHQARPFYGIIILSLLLGLGMNYLGISPVKALIYTAVLYGCTAPVLIAIIMHICNNKKIMKEHTNGLRSNILGIITLLIMTAAAVTLLILELS